MKNLQLKPKKVALALSLILNFAASTTAYSWTLPSGECPAPDATKKENQLLVAALDSEGISLKDLLNFESNISSKSYWELSRGLFRNCSMGTWLSYAEFTVEFKKDQWICSQNFSVKEELKSGKIKDVATKVVSEQPICSR